MTPAQINISSQGSIYYPPEPETEPNVNLAHIPDAWGHYDGTTVYYSDGPQIVFVDNSVTHNGNPSIRIDPHVEGVDKNKYREVNLGYIPVQPGDHIVFKVWIKTGHSTLDDDANYGNGGIMLFDYHGANGRLSEHSSDNPRCDVEPYQTWTTYLNDPSRYVPFNSDWTLRTLDTIVPDFVIDDKSIVDANTFSFAVPTGIYPVFQASGYIVEPNLQQDQGVVWFADAELYINPS